MAAVSSRTASPASCALCSNIKEPSDPWDRPIFESPNFIAIPSLGALVEGWMLVVPRRHVLSIGTLPAELWSEFEGFKREVSDHVASAYGCVCAFEHGPSAPNRQAGCGVDHAHVHIVPIDFDLVAASGAKVPISNWEHASWSACSRAAASGLDYLFVEQPLGTGRMAAASQFSSQILRRTIAEGIGKADEFDWRSHRQEQNIERTMDRLSSVAAE